MVKRIISRRDRNRTVALREQLENERKNTFVQQNRLMQRMAEDNLDILQNIELRITETARSNNIIDDRCVSGALKTLLTDQPTNQEHEIELCEVLNIARRSQSDVTDKIWRDGLQVVLDSVHNHSDLEPGEKNYLKFISGFIL